MKLRTLNRKTSGEFRDRSPAVLFCAAKRILVKIILPARGKPEPDIKPTTPFASEAVSPLPLSRYLHASALVLANKQWAHISSSAMFDLLST